MRYTAAVLTISDKGSRGERVDTSGPALCEMLRQAGWDVVHTAILPDERDQIEAEMIACADRLGVALVLATGGTGFSPRDVTPEATLAVVERRAPGIPEAMRAESLRLTPKGCLSRAEAGIRGRTLIVDLPGSEKAARENLSAVLGALRHGADMLLSAGSADCAESAARSGGRTPPSMDAWLREAKADPSAGQVGMYLVHHGVVRATAKSQVRGGGAAKAVGGMRFSYDQAKVDAAIREAKALPGIAYVRAWLNEGDLTVGDDIMYVLVGGDIRPHVIDALQQLVGQIKGECVREEEIYQ